LPKCGGFGFLKKQGHEVLLAASGPEALAHVKDRQVDLVLSDCRMPGMSGPELLLGIKAVNPEIPLILMTAYGTVETAVQAMKDGAPQIHEEIAPTGTSAWEDWGVARKSRSYKPVNNIAGKVLISYGDIEKTVGAIMEALNDVCLWKTI
jgi:CheY-like chemotaxis protein